MMILRLTAIATMATAFLLGTSVASLADETVTRGNNLAVDASADGRLLMDLAGGIWIVPLGGGEAVRVSADLASAHRPRWSPDASRVVYTAIAGDNNGIWIHDLASNSTRRLSESPYFDLYPTWHPSGERVTYVSDRNDSGYDLWEVDVPTGLHWRLSSRTGDETEPAWSADGRDLLYIHKKDEQWSLVLRRQGEPEEILVTGTDRLAGPSWRPDGSLVTFWRETDTGTSLDMVILSQPRLTRRYADGEDFVTAPVSWLDRHRMVYSAGGVIRQRLFNSWSSRTVPFRATITSRPDTVIEPVRRSLARSGEPEGSIVIHAARLFDGLGGDYRRDVDIVIDSGRIRTVESHTERPDAIVIDMGDLVVLPGLVDVQARLPADTDEIMGPMLLASGVTTIVSDHPEAEHLNKVWSGKDLPGPRVLPAADWPVADFSGLADSNTPGIDSLLGSRQANLVGFDDVIARRFSEPPTIDYGATAIVLGSSPNGLPAGIAVHAELRALVAAGLRPDQALRAAGVNAAAALGVDPTLGRIATGAVGDLVMVDGDPLQRVDDALNIVAVVRNGRFFSVAGLIDRVRAARTVE
jgi:hypothetical protein